MAAPLTAMNQQAKYLEVQVATAPPEKLVLMCYDGIIRFLNQAHETLAEGDLEGGHRSIVRAQAIVAELKGSLNMELGEIPRNLARIYDFLHEHLVEANIRKDKGRVAEALRVTNELRGVWEEVCQVTRSATGTRW